jgi:hypothetical protein
MAGFTMTILTHDVRNTQENLEIDTAQSLEQPTLSMVDPVSFIYSVNQTGRNKTWDFSRLTNGFKNRTGTIEDLKTAVKSGFAINGAHFKEKIRNAENVTKIGLLLVDIDDGMTIEQALEHPLINEYCALAYTTFSHTEDHHKFRLIFILPEVMNRDDFESLVKFFLSKLPADKSCSDSCRAFYGNTEAQFFIDNPTAILPQEWIEKAIEQSQVSTQKIPSKPEKKEPVLFSSKENQVLCDSERDRCLALDILKEFPASANGDNNYPVYREIGVVLKNVLGESEALSILENHSPDRNWKQILSSSNGSHDIGTLVYHVRKLIPNWEHPEWWKKSRPNNKEWRQENVIPINKKVKNDQKKLVNEVRLVHDNCLKGSDLSVALNGLAKDFELHISQVQKIYDQVGSESEYSREETENELKQLVATQNDTIDIESFFPPVLSNPIKQLAKWQNIKPEVYALALMCGISSVLKPDTKLILHSQMNFKVSPGLYIGLVAESSQKKTPVIDSMITSPLSKLQQDEKEKYVNELKDYESLLEQYETLKKERGSKTQLGQDFPEGKPIPPTRTFRFFSDSTSEALKSQIAKQPDQGILLNVDELSSVFNGANQYKGGKGNDMEALLSLYDGTGFCVNRKTETIDVERALLSIYGGIQPETLQKLLGNGKDGNGQWARFIFIQQPLVAGSFPDDDGSGFKLGELIEAFYWRISNFPAMTYKLTSESFKAFKESYLEFEEGRINSGGGPMGNVYGKSEGRVGKLAITLHTIKYAAKQQFPPEYIDVDTIQQAIALTQFSINQVKSLYSQLDPNALSMAPQLLKIHNLAINKNGLTARVAGQLTRMKANKLRECFSELQAMGMGEVRSEGKTEKYFAYENSRSVESVDKCRQSATPDKPIYSEVYSQSVVSVDKKPDFSKNLNLEDSDFLHKESSTLSTLEPQSLTGNEFGCVAEGLHLSTLEESQNLQTTTQQGFESSLENVYTSQPDYQFKVGDRVSNPLWGETVITEIDPVKGAKGVWSYQKSESYAPIPSLTLLVEAA